MALHGISNYECAVMPSASKHQQFAEPHEPTLSIVSYRSLCQPSYKLPDVKRFSANLFPQNRSAPFVPRVAAIALPCTIGASALCTAVVSVWTCVLIARLRVARNAWFSLRTGLAELPRGHPRPIKLPSLDPSLLERTISREYYRPLE